ncbi:MULTISPECIES: hypothetical protein [unclassified Streptomyces]|nr:MULTISPECIES: hypothetical protein [unclassified Streptomyces]MCC9707516.1 hypothetical protein [Streptomyces sp. MNU76]WNZ13688.1 hypothetical protein P8T65_43080 [Streptomyces sp. 11x1]
MKSVRLCLRCRAACLGVFIACPFRKIELVSHYSVTAGSEKVADDFSLNA